MSVIIIVIVGAIVGGYVYRRQCRKAYVHTPVIPNPEKTEEAQLMNSGICPHCREHDRLLQGPSGGVGMNVLCQSCLKEYTVFVAPGGIFKVDTIGKIGEARARDIYGLEGTL